MRACPTNDVSMCVQQTYLPGSGRRPVKDLFLQCRGCQPTLVCHGLCICVSCASSFAANSRFLYHQTEKKPKFARFFSSVRLCLVMCACMCDIKAENPSGCRVYGAIYGSRNSSSNLRLAQPHLNFSFLATCASYQFSLSNPEPASHPQTGLHMHAKQYQTYDSVLTSRPWLRQTQATQGACMFVGASHPGGIGVYACGPPLSRPAKLSRKTSIARQANAHKKRVLLRVPRCFRGVPPVAKGTFPANNSFFPWARGTYVLQSWQTLPPCSLSKVHNLSGQGTQSQRNQTLTGMVWPGHWGRQTMQAAHKGVKAL